MGVASSRIGMTRRRSTEHFLSNSKVYGARTSVLGGAAVLKMFILVRFGADEEELFNPDCAIRLLFESVKKRCQCMDKDNITFMDEKGNLVHIQDDKSMESAAKFFTHRGIYTLLAMDKRGDVTSYIPLIDDPSKELLVKLESLSAGANKSLKGSTSMRRGSRTPQSTMKSTNQLSGKGKRK